MNNYKVMKDMLRQYIIEATFSSEDDIKDDTLLFEEGLFDSMGLLFLIDFIRDEFHIDTKDNELLVENFASIDSISVFVLDRLGVNESCKIVNTSK